MNKRKQISRKKMYVLSAALLAGSVSMAPIASAADSPYIASEEITFGDNVFAEIKFLKEGEGIGRGQDDKDYIVDKAVYDLPKELIQGTLDSTVYWSDILGAGAKNTTPWQIFVNTEKDQNAGATSNSIESDGVGQAMNSYNHAVNYIGEQIQDGVVLSTITYDNAKTGVLPKGNYGLSEITIGDYMGANRTDAINGWWIDTDTVLPTNEQAADFVGTIRHELGHALGISLQTGTTSAGALCINDSITDTKSWTLHLYDQNGNQAKAGKPIVTSSAIGSGDVSQYFVVDTDTTSDGKGYAYFMGDNVTDALGGATFFGRSGLPVNGWEGSTFEGSHLQTAGMMSHRPYSNYTSFMEAELAVMQDLGYNIDRKAFFGRSIYGNGGTIDNTQGFFARNEAGTAYLDNTYSTVPLGIGLHIYGSENVVMQSANILTKGVGGTGIRVDGTENTLVIPAATEIHADGTRGNGILVAYGRNQTVDQAGTVTANGDGGTGVRFDFGSSSNGATDEYRGSYIRYKRGVNSAGEINQANNLDITDMNANTYNANAQELNGPQVVNYNLSGTLSGAGNAIYISKNAFVKNININSGAAITGNITSDWKQFGADECEGAYERGFLRERLTIQYNGKRGSDGYLYPNYIPDLVTNLNINTDLNYAGDITGEDNMKLNVTAGTFKYSGSADVVNVTVAKDAALFGGYFKVNDMSENIDSEDGFSDTTTGKFYNHGTIGPNSANEDLEITGNLESDGTLYAYAGGSKGSIVVSGKANIDGSTVTAENSLPGESISVLSANSVNGTITNTKDNPHVETGMLNTYGVVGSDNVTVHTVAANNLGDLSDAQQTAFDRMNNMVQSLSAAKDSRLDEMRALYSMDSTSAKAALSAVGETTAPQTISSVQRNPLMSHILSARMNEVFATRPVTISIPSSNLSAGPADSSEVTAKLAQPVDNEFWFKTSKNWGSLQGDANYHGTAMALGWDKAISKYSRAGVFVGYGLSNMADKGSNNGVKDTRLGIYLGTHKGAGQSMLYLNYGWLSNHLQRNLSALGLSTDVRYGGRILELGGEYKHDLHAYKASAWHVSPYVNFQASRLWQSGYTEDGAGVYGQSVSEMTNNYFGAGLGLEFRRYLSKGSYALRIGAKHAFAGADPKLSFGYVGDETNRYEVRNRMDKTRMVVSIGGETEFAPGWTLSGDAAFEKGAHDRDLMLTVLLRRMW